jgi:hypothetical protein
MSEKRNVTSKDVVKIAIDIIEHTDELSLGELTYVCDVILANTQSFMSKE